MCTHESHAALKSDPLRFRRETVFAFVMDDGDGGTLECRNCKCGSTLSVEQLELQVAELSAAAVDYFRRGLLAEGLSAAMEAGTKAREYAELLKNREMDERDARAAQKVA